MPDTILPTIDNLRAEREKLREERAAIVAAAEKRADEVRAEARTAGKSDDEVKTIRATVTPEAEVRLTAISTELAELEPRIDELADAEIRSLRTSGRLVDVGLAAAPGAQVRIKREPMTYERHNMQTSYFSDLVEAGRGSIVAQERIAKHQQEMRVELPKFEQAHFARQAAERGLPDGYEFETRDITRTDGAGGEFVPPLWMMADYIALQRAGRVTADLCRRRPLPSGTDSINLPKVSGGTATAMQTADNAAVQETDITTTSVSGAVQTIAGQQDAAIQLVEQSPLMFDEVIFSDLAADHAQKIGAQVLTGTGANGQVLGFYTISSVDTTTYTDASPTVPELYPKMADSANEIATNRFLPLEAIVMHPRRWYWMTSQLDSSSRPLVVPIAQGPNNALGSFAGESKAEGLVGMSPWGPIYIDPNTPKTATSGAGTSGTEDKILLTRPSDAWLFEGPVRTRALLEVLSGNLTVRFQLYSYVAFIPHRYASSTSVVSGTGLAAPTF